VESMIAVGTTAASSTDCVRIAAEHPSVFASVGIQPNYCAEAAPGDWEKIVQLASKPKVVALGETGLDRYWDHTPFEIQQDYFDRHIQLSQQTGLPFIVHMRDCGGDILSMLREARERTTLCGVMHSFTGDAQLAEACLELGLYISFAGMVTYKKSIELREVAAQIPEDRLLIETDAPYLSPHPKRGQRPNEPALVVHTAECLAEVRGVDLKTLALQTTENARRLFQISD
jgi:TatD DNase family protein